MEYDIVRGFKIFHVQLKNVIILQNTSTENPICHICI